MTMLSARVDRNKVATIYHASGETEGRDPRAMTAEELESIGHVKTPLLKVIRAKCLDCSHTFSEAAKCTACDCSLWPYRRGVMPDSWKSKAKQELAKARFATLKVERK